MKNIFYLSNTRRINFSKGALTDENDREIAAFSKPQLNFLEKLIANEGNIVTKGELLDYTWGIDSVEKDEESLKHILKAINRIDNQLFKSYIKSARSVGYKFKCQYPQEESKYPPAQAFDLPRYYVSRFQVKANLPENLFLTDSQRVHAFIGESGIGKTSLARDYANSALRAGKYKHIRFTSYASSLKETLEHLCEGGKEKPLDASLRMLADMQKDGNTLLIIDNYDRLDYIEELAYGKEPYDQLCATGCRILITSTLDLSQCYRINDNVTKLQPLPLDDLVRIFFNVLGKSSDKESDVRELIDRYLLKNTYLTVLCAELAKQEMSAREIVDAIINRRADEIGYFAAQKDGRRWDEMSLIEHFCRVLDNNRIINPEDSGERRKMHGLLSVLSLIPLEGVNESDFLNAAFPYSKKKEAGKLIARLKNHNILFRNKDKIYLQPIIKEYLLRTVLFFGEDVLYYLNSLTKNLTVNNFNSTMMHWLSIAQAAYDVIRDEHLSSAAIERTQEIESANENKSEECLTVAVFLGSRIVMCFSAVDIYDQAYHYGVLTLPNLRRLANDSPNCIDALTFALYFDRMGYAYLHGDSKYSSENMKITFECINTSFSLVERARSSGKNDIECVAAETKCRGTLAAYYIKQKNYIEALRLHTLALVEREKLLLADPDCEEYKRMLAFTYRGVGTDHFYISRDIDRVEHLKLSYLYHQKSVEIFEGLYGYTRLETIESGLRLVGTAILLMSLVTDIELVELIEVTSDELYDALYSRIESTFGFFSTCGIQLNKQIEDMLKNLITMSQMRLSCGKFVEANADFNARIAETVRNIAYIAPSCLENAEKLKAIFAPPAEL